MKVIAADGDALFLEILRTCLNAREIETRITRERPDCIAMMRSEPPDLLVLESDLAWGPEGVATAMAADPALREIPVILLTDSRRWERLPDFPRVIDRLRKPFRLITLLVTIREVEARFAPVELSLDLADAIL